MAAPTVADADTTTGTQSSSNTTWSFTYPSNISAGDLLIAFFAISSAGGLPGSAIPAGWVNSELFATATLAIKKKATGSESGSVNITFGASVTGHWVVYRITGWDSNIGINWASTFSIGSGSGAAGGTASGTSTTPDPPSLTTSGLWDSTDDALAIAVAGVPTNQTFSGFPSGYTNTYSVNDANGGSLALARKTVTSTTEDPGTFTIGSSATWGAATILIHGANGPAIQDADSKDGVVTSNSASWTLTYPSNLASGDLILILVAADGTGANAATATGFTDCNSVGSTASVQCLAKISDGTETGTFTLSMGGGASEQGTWVTMRITQWFGAGLPSGDNAHDGTGLDSAQTTETTTTTPDPPNLDPGQWGTETTLWMAVAGNDGTATTTGWPFTPRNYSRSSGGAGGANLMFCTNVANASSKNPGTFTIGSEQVSCLTIGVRPAAVVVAAPTFGDTPLPIIYLRANK